MKKIKSNKGISLIELLISLAILSISILAISNLVGVGINTNKRAEIKQQGLILGQQILEEIQLLSSDDEYKENASRNKLVLPSELILQGEQNNQDSEETYKYKGNKSVEGINYDIEIDLKKNSSIDYKDSESENDSLSISPKTTLDFEIDKNDITYISNEEKQHQINSKNIYLKVLEEKNSDKKLYIGESINNTDYEIGDLEGNNVVLKITKYDNSQNNIIVNIYNNLSEKLNVYIIKPYKCKQNIQVQNNKGLLTVIDNLRYESTTDDLNVENLYEIKVTIKNNNKSVFEGYANKNLKLNN